VIGEPALEEGAVQLTVAEVRTIDLVAVTSVGAPGTATGVTGLEAPEAGPVPTAFVAVMTKV
jgi:hypothetical protein